MKSLLKAIGAILRAMRRAARAMVRTTVWIGGQLVSMFVPASMPELDELEPDDAAPANDNAVVDESAGIRDLAYCQLTGRRPTAQQLGAVTALQCGWIASMDAEMCRRVIAASDAEIRAHLRGNKAIRGVLWCEEAAIDDYQTALVIDNARRERDLELDQPFRPKMPA